MNDATLSNSRKKLLLLAGIAFVPLFIAYGMFFFAPGLAPSDTKNNGQLIQPPLEATALETPTRQWSILVLTKDVCDASCEERLYLTRQIHTALGKDSERVIRRWVRTNPVSSDAWQTIKPEHPGLEPWISADLQSTLETYSRTQFPGTETAVFLADPLGNIMMAFPDDQVGKPLLEDLKLLLKVSKLG